MTWEVRFDSDPLVNRSVLSAQPPLWTASEYQERGAQRLEHFRLCLRRPIVKENPSSFAHGGATSGKTLSRVGFARSSTAVRDSARACGTYFLFLPTYLRRQSPVKEKGHGPNVFLSLSNQPFHYIRSGWAKGVSLQEISPVQPTVTAGVTRPCSGMSVGPQQTG